MDIANNEKIQTVQGGKTRAESVLYALETIKENSLIVVHDAVRPFVTVSLVNKLMKKLISNKGVIPAVQINDSVKYINKEIIIKNLDRKNLGDKSAGPLFWRGGAGPWAIAHSAIP